MYTQHVIIYVYYIQETPMDDLKTTRMVIRIAPTEVDKIYRIINKLGYDITLSAYVRNAIDIQMKIDLDKFNRGG